MKFSALTTAGIALVLTLAVLFIVIINYQEPVDFKIDNTRDERGESTKIPEINGTRNITRDPDIDINNPESCKTCHLSIYNEWYESNHRNAHIKPLYRTFAFFKPDGTPGTPMCENCHISEATLEVAPLAQPVSRRDAGSKIRSKDGIDCASCHRRHGQIVGTKGSLKGCFAVGDKFLSTSKYCGGCHKSFLPNTLHEYEEWAANPAKISVKKHCNHCHMPDVSGSSTDGVGTHKSHRFFGAYDAKMLKKAFDFKVKFRIIDGDAYFILTIINKGTGHHFPTGTAKRRVKLEVLVTDSAEMVLGDRIVYLQKPPRYSDSPGTQVPDRESRDFHFQFDMSENDAMASLKITYLHFPDEIDDENILLVNKTFAVPNEIALENR
ncbi:MAG: cytochrome c family protein [Planctomycetes bacterium]|nr:cytochrome c family protein [Planctomycetota bacterium]